MKKFQNIESRVNQTSPSRRGPNSPGRESQAPSTVLKDNNADMNSVTSHIRKVQPGPQSTVSGVTSMRKVIEADKEQTVKEVINYEAKEESIYNLVKEEEIPEKKNYTPSKKLDS